MNIWQIVFLIILYFSWCLGSSFFRQVRGMSGTPVPFLILFGMLSWQSLVVLGFLIIKWYFFVPIVIIFAFGPILTIVNFLPNKIISNTSILETVLRGRPKFDDWVINNHQMLSITNIIVAIALWLKYFEYF